MKLIDEIRSLSPQVEDHRKKEITEALRKTAERGEHVAKISPYRKDVADWLVSEGFQVEIIDDFRNGDYMKIFW